MDCSEKQGHWVQDLCQKRTYFHDLMVCWQADNISRHIWECLIRFFSCAGLAVGCPSLVWANIRLCHDDNQLMDTFSESGSKQKRSLQGPLNLHTQQPSLNRDTGCDLPTIYDDLLSHDLALTGGHMPKRVSSQCWMKRLKGPCKLHICFNPDLTQTLQN